MIDRGGLAKLGSGRRRQQAADLPLPSRQIALWSRNTRPNLSFVRAGTLDDPRFVSPDAHIFVRSKLPWVALPSSVPAVEVYYDTRTLWPGPSLASLARLQALS